jgi:hypothetical protein
MMDSNTRPRSTGIRNMAEASNLDVSEKFLLMRPVSGIDVRLFVP